MAEDPGECPSIRLFDRNLPVQLQGSLHRRIDHVLVGGTNRNDVGRFLDTLHSSRNILTICDQYSTQSALFRARSEMPSNSSMSRMQGASRQARAKASLIACSVRER